MPRKNNSTMVLYEKIKAKCLLNFHSILIWIKTHKWEFSILTIIFIAGFFLRTYHFSSWLHFEIDQAYDIQTVSPALDKGISNLTLFGPNVGGGALRLGPAFYYMEYIAGLLFGNTPPGHAMAVLLLNIAAIPLFYIFCRKYFTVPVALGLDAVFSLSLFSVMYSRFSWSPNVLPFLITFSFFALLQSFSPKEKHPARWFLISVAAVTITSQIHFNSFFVIPLIAVLFTAIKMPRFPFKVWFAAIGIIFLIYSPMIASDIKTRGENLRLFKHKFERTAGVNTSKEQSLSQAILYSAYGNWFILTANDQLNNTKLKGYGFSCNECRQDLNVKYFAIALFILSFLLILFNIFREKEKSKKDFLILSGLWILTSIYLFYTIAKSYRMYPRFYLMTSPLAVLMLGFILQYIKPHISKLRLLIFSVIIFLLVAINVQKIAPIFDQLANVTIRHESNIEDGDIFPNTNRLTYEEELRLIDFIESKYKKNDYPVYLSAGSEYEYAYWYLLERRGIQYYDEIRNEKLFADANYFIIKFAQDRQNIDGEFKIEEKKDLGTLIVYYVKPLPQFVAAQIQHASEKKTSEEDEIVKSLYTWKSLFK